MGSQGHIAGSRLSGRNLLRNFHPSGSNWTQAVVGTGGQGISLNNFREVEFSPVVGIVGKAIVETACGVE